MVTCFLCFICRCKCHCPFLLSHFHLTCPVPLLFCLPILPGLFFSLVCTCVPPALSQSVSVCMPSPHWYALLPSTLSLTLHMIVLFSLSFSHFLSLSSCLIVAFFVYLCFSLSSASVCVCCFSISVSIPLLPNPLYSSLVVVVVVVVVVVYFLH